ncbi:hypothetical protein OIV83_001335 [Microbotryomycetes sp. JL201]|nr:hypothetical protein OIV83_001335 [Microbotryomycetes sp. JL201]
MALVKAATPAVQAPSAVATALQLWALPTVSLSLVIEAERPVPSIVRLLSRFALLWRPTLLRDTLEWELDSGRFADHVISATTLRVVDAAYHRQIGHQANLRSTPIYPEELVVSIAAAEGVDNSSEAYNLLERALERIMAAYDVVDKVVERTEDEFDPEDANSQKRLRELFERLKPGEELPGMVSKRWQEIGFQGTSPSTDFRDLNSLALDALLYFATEYESQAVQIVEESVNGGANWYPLALAMIHMTAFALDLALSRDLQLFLLRSFQTKASTDPAPSDLGPFLRAASELMLLFHAHWLRSDYNVMQFEQVSKEYQAALRPWIRRGVMDGRPLGWDNGSRIKSD